MKTYDTLYKRTSTGATQIWYVEQDSDSYRTVSGQIDGQKVTSQWTVAKPKNVGKSNETTAAQQATLEVEAKYTKKLAQGGYHTTPDAIDQAKFFKPMLAKNYNDYPITELGPWDDVYSQPKLDGMRCIANKDGLWTRQGKPIVAVPHIERALEKFFNQHPAMYLDGELYCDRLSDDFGKLLSLCRKVNPDQARLDEAEEFIEFHVYDAPIFRWGFKVRWEELDGMLVTSSVGHPVVKVETTQVDGPEHLDELYAGYMERGYEGQMIRIDDVPYENKRSKSLLKRKEFIDEEFPIVEIQEGDGNRTGMAGTVIYRLPNGELFGSGIKGTHAYCIELLKNADSYSQGTGTVRYQHLSPDGVPRFPVTVALYEGERDV